jgi:16S rRNA (cytidine1402-2'-O)-methyltransferase
MISIVATPIGNLEDITLRALKTLKNCDLIVCEDTRVTSKLLNAHGISKPLRSLHEHSNPRQIEQLIEEAEEKHLCYVTDAGTPGMNDPGGRLVEAAFEAGIKIEPLPGASALTTAISVCGFAMDEFT